MSPASCHPPSSITTTLTPKIIHDFCLFLYLYNWHHPKYTFVYLSVCTCEIRSYCVCGYRLCLLLLRSGTPCDGTRLICSCQRACGGPPLTVLERALGCAHAGLSLGAHWGREPQPQGASVQGRRVLLGRRGWRGPEVFTLASARASCAVLVAIPVRVVSSLYGFALPLLVTDGGEHLVACSLATWISSFVKVQF